MRVIFTVIHWHLKAVWGIFRSQKHKLISNISSSCLWLQEVVWCIYFPFVYPLFKYTDNNRKILIEEFTFSLCRRKLPWLKHVIGYYEFRNTVIVLEDLVDKLESRKLWIIEFWRGGIHFFRLFQLPSQDQLRRIIMYISVQLFPYICCT